VGISNTTNNKNGEGEVKNNEHFMDEHEIRDSLRDKIVKNRRLLHERLHGRRILVGSRERTIEDENIEGDPLPWIEPDHDIDHHRITRHGEDKERHEFTYLHMESLDKDGYYTCNNLTDKWYEWHIKNPASISGFTNPSHSYEGGSAFLFQDNDRYFKDIDEKISVYFAAASPFQDPPDFRTITMVRRVPILVPVYNMSASTEDYTSIKTDDDLKQLIIEDLSGIIELKAWFDRIPIEGCCVIRKKRLSVTNVPIDNVNRIPEDRMFESGNSIKTCHGGYWLLIRKDKLTSGEHLLEFSAVSKNYEVDAKILINVLV
jgi:hypothetical protein